MIAKSAKPASRTSIAKRLVAVLSLSVALAGFGPTAYAAVMAELFPGSMAVEGLSSGPVEITSFNFGIASTTSMSTGGKVVAAVGPVTVTRKVDSLTPLLMTAAASGETLPEVQLQALGKTAEKYGAETVTLILSNARVEHVSLAGTGEAAAEESLSLVFDKVELVYGAGKAATTFRYEMPKQ